VRESTRRVITVAVVALTLACSGTGPDDGNQGPLFAALPMPEQRVVCVHQLGELAAPGELLGAVMSRWDVRETGACGAPASFVGDPVPVHAAASGTVVVATPGGLVTIAVNDNLEYTYRGVVLDGFIAQGNAVTAGQRLGILANPDSGLAFGVVDFGHVNPWVTEARYPDPFRHARHPRDYYVGALRSFVDSRTSTSLSTDGRLVWDVAGTLAGNWFAEGIPQTAQAVAPPAWGGHLSFHTDGARHWIGMGSDLDGAGGCACIAGTGSARFDTVTPASGPVVYTVFATEADGTPAPVVRGTLLVEMLEADRIRAEYFPGIMTDPDFTATALEYVR
jgi:hypothetical protein